MKTMLDYIKKEQEVHQSILEKDLFENKLIDLNPKAPRNVVIYATGSSANAAYGAYILMQEVLDVPIYIKEPSLSLHYDPLVDDQTLILAISQGGHSYATIEMVKQLVKENRQVYVLTSDPDSPIAQVGAQVINLSMGIETMPYVTLGYTVTILVLWLMALTLAKKWQRIDDIQFAHYLEQIDRAIRQADMVIKSFDDWYSQHKQTLLAAKHFVFIGYGACYGIAREAETKLTETCHIPTHGHELEEYMHGPYLGLQKNDALFLLESCGTLKGRMNKLRIFLDRHIDQTYQITIGASDRIQDLSLQLGNLPENLAPLVMSIPIHMMSFYLSQMKGFNLHQSFYPEFDEITGSKV
ncbi:SIS domain-containing protein [Allofustis seminis]|uniref:SIS domain-containing protein n=1 Tax=Allofustis seminis TaxID=166939 RepID=UPI0003A2C3AF|nr:SIS domain-containing protein [Allofustis seminis]